MRYIRNFFIRRSIISYLYIFIFSEFLLIGASLNYSNSELIKLVKKFVNNTSTEQEKAILFANNNTINNLAMAGKISKDEYNLVQKDFVKKNDEIIAKAAEKCGLAVGSSRIQEVYKPGTDTDRQLKGVNNRKITFNDVIKVRETYNNEVESYLRMNNVKTKDITNWAKELKTDIMPSPFEMSAKEFKLSNEYINKQGGVAYTDANAAKVQLKLESGVYLSPGIHEARSYFAEMQEKIKMMNNDIIELNNAKLKAKSSDEKEIIEIEIRKRNAYIAKYLERMNKISDYISSPYSQEVQKSLSEEVYNAKSERLIKNAQIRDSSKLAQNSEIVVNTLQQKLAFNSMRRFNENIIKYGISNGNLDEAIKVVANNINNLSPNVKSQVISDIEIKYGDKVSKGIVRVLKNRSQPHSELISSKNLSIANKLGAINKIVNIGSQYMQGKTTTQILWDMTLGNFENVSNETAKYVNLEISRLKLQYALNGEDPESITTKLKIMTQASVKGTIYGSVLGGYELFKLTSKSLAGTAINLAEGLIYFAGEAIDTNNVLEETRAVLRAQDMEQKVQNAKAVVIAKNYLDKLKELSELREYYKNLFRQNILAAKELKTVINDKVEQIENQISIYKRRYENISKENIHQTILKTTQKMNFISSEIQKIENEVNVLQKLLNKQIYNNINEMRLQVDKAYKWFLSIKANLIEEEKQIEEIKELTPQFHKEFAEFYNLSKKQIKSNLEHCTINATMLEKNVENYKKIVSIFQELKTKILNSEKYFVDKRESNEFDWLSIKTRLNDIPELSLNDIPSDMYYYINLLKDFENEVLSKFKIFDSDYNTLSDRVSPILDSSNQSEISKLITLNDSLRSKVDNLESKFKQLLDIINNLKQNILVNILCPSEVIVDDKFIVNVALKDTDGRLDLNNYLVEVDFGDGKRISNNANLNVSLSHFYSRVGNYKVTARIVPKYSANNLMEQIIDSKYIYVKDKINKQERIDKKEKSTNNNTSVKNQNEVKGNKSEENNGVVNNTSQRLPCGHLPGQCPKSGIGALKCSLSKGQISQSKGP